MVTIIEKNLFDAPAVGILHQVNCKGVMGAGVAKQVRMRYPIVYEKYRNACAQYANSSELLGKIQRIPVKWDVSGKAQQHIVNVFSQDGYGYTGCYTNYSALRKAFDKVNTVFSKKTIALPYLMGCDRGGGNWETVLEIINETLKDCNVLICKLPK